MSRYRARSQYLKPVFQQEFTMIVRLDKITSSQSIQLSPFKDIHVTHSHALIVLICSFIFVLMNYYHYLTMIGGTISVPFILTPAMCIEDSDPVRSQLVSTIIFVSGIITVLQSTIGSRQVSFKFNNFLQTK